MVEGRRQQLINLHNSSSIFMLENISTSYFLTWEESDFLSEVSPQLF